MRILFLSDIHGSNEVFNKALLAAVKYDIDVLIVSGDLSGKDIRPIIENKNEYFVEYNGEREKLSKSSISKIEKKLSDSGHYFFHITKDEFSNLKNEPSQIFNILNNKILERIEQWINQIIKQIDLRTTIVVISPGNDDFFAIDTLLKNYENKGIFSGLNIPIKVDNFEIVSLDYSNPTPWKTDRELPEKKLKKLINEKVCRLDSFERAIFNFHCPPYNTKLDIAPKIDKNFRYVINPGSMNTVHTGSKAVREAIEKYQPILSLHGHIHESQGFDYLGKTLSLNPGSEYEKGILNAYFIDVLPKGVIKNYYLIEE